MGLWFRNSEKNQGPVFTAECLLIVKQIEAVFFSGFEQSEF